MIPGTDVPNEYLHQPEAVTGPYSPIFRRYYVANKAISDKKVEIQ